MKNIVFAVLPPFYTPFTKTSMVMMPGMFKTAGQTAFDRLA
jgi:hypothetical protein